MAPFVPFWGHSLVKRNLMNRMKGDIFKLLGDFGSQASLEVTYALATHLCEAGMQCQNYLPSALIFS